ncbi:MAG: ABC-F family ATP-binding cassette domain-containing protein [Chlorobi bacterium]|nr:ABC-F family ATP-binding cassette domain-containing protein [Chlorobiota bacterium]
MLRLENVHIVLGGTTIVEDISFQMSKGERLALTGRNGAGKTTLLRAIAGEIEPAEGHIHRPKDMHIGYLRQMIRPATGRTLMEEAETAFPEIKNLEAEIQRLEVEMERQADAEAAERLAALTYRYELLGGYTYRGRLERVLKGLGFSRDDFHRPLASFSGGWQMRVELAKILAAPNDLLLLDEPTNYLDLESIIWLEQFLAGYEGMVILVSHDRRFLDKVSTRTLELWPEGYLDLPFPYSEFQQKKKEIIEKMRRDAANQEKEIKHMQQLIDRFRYKATKASFAQSLIKKLEKMERINVPEPDVPPVRIRFPEAAPPGKVVFRAEGLSKSYGSKQVLKDLEFHMARGEKIAFVGRNGMGKTTLASILAGENDYEGRLERGHNVRIGYLAQDSSRKLPEHMRILDYLEDRATDQTRSRVRDVAGAFLFPGDDVYKPIGVLSGGERNRVALAGMMLQSFNVLILDEPTHHLDIPSKEVLKSALKDFSGTLIVVSHDRDFLEGLTEQTWEFRPLEVRKFPGDINDFLSVRRVNGLEELERQTSAPGHQSKEEQNAKKGRIHRQRSKERRRCENRLRKIEAEIEVKEAELSAMESRLAGGEAGDADFYKTYALLKEEIDHLYQTWEQHQEACSHLLEEE